MSKEWVCSGCGINILVDDDYEYKHCCSGAREQCGCMGRETNPVFCGVCEKKISEYDNKLDNKGE